MISHYSLEDVIGKKETGRSDEHGEKHLAGSGGTYENAIPKKAENPARGMANTQ